MQRELMQSSLLSDVTILNFYFLRAGCPQQIFAASSLCQFSLKADGGATLNSSGFVSL